jgi:Txe/YoeB family toxin of Txe-Axe toxin-antitoxin module
MKFVFPDEAWEDYLHWQKHDKRMVYRVEGNALMIAQLRFHY